jgi:hypothetical protein
MIKKKFKYGNEEIPMFMGYRLAMNKMEDLGLDILSALDGQSTCVQTIMLNDKVMLKVAYYYVNEHRQTDFDEFLDTIDETKDFMHNFRNTFWELVLGFMPRQAEHALKKMKAFIEKQLREVDVKISSDSSADSLEEQA